MELSVDGELQKFVPLAQFRNAHNLPTSFTIATFEPKEVAGLGRLDPNGRAALNSLQTYLIRQIPRTVRKKDLFHIVKSLTEQFHLLLMRANTHIGLREVEVEFAVAGLHDCLQTGAYHLLQADNHFSGNPTAIANAYSPAAAYREWLYNSVRTGVVRHLYHHNNDQFYIQVIYSAYGRVGMQVTLPTGQTSFIADGGLACPAENFMAELMKALLDQLGKAYLAGLTAPP